MNLLYNFDTETLEEQATLIKNIFIQFMYLNEMIDEKLFNHLWSNYAIIVRKPTFFGSIWKKFMKKADTAHYIIIKQESLAKDEDGKAGEPPNLKVVKLDKDKDKE